MPGAHDRDGTVLQRLAQQLEDVAAELRELVEKQDATMGEADLSRSRDQASADKPRSGDGVVWSAKGTFAQSRDSGPQAPGDAVHDRRFERLLVGERREDAGETLREQCFARTWGTDEEEVVSAGRGDLERSPGQELPAHLREIGKHGARDVDGALSPRARRRGDEPEARRRELVRDLPERIRGTHATTCRARRLGLVLGGK